MNTFVQNTQMPHLKKLFLAGLILLATTVMSSHLAAEETTYNDAAGLGDLKEAKGVFWLSLKDVRKTAKYLQVITGTHQRFIEQGVKPEMILMFNGPMVGFFTTEPKDEVAMQHGKYLQSISKSVAKLHELGVRMEVCGVANEIVGVDPETLLPGLINVSDGAISLIGWQYQGYKMVPIF